MRENFNLENHEPEITHKHELDEKDFREKIEKCGEAVSRHSVVEIIHSQEKLQNNYIFLNSEGAMQLIEKAHDILVEMGYERQGKNWVKKNNLL